MSFPSPSAPTPVPPAAVDDLMEFVDEEPQAAEAAKPWRILVVDDEPDVHLTTTAALADVRILDRPLQFLHAYSADEATAVLKRESDIAVVLLDVVMEREDSGLELVHTIRDEFRLTDLRIILRTGQPGYAPEIETIHDYDINDYKTKSELTRTKLFASVTAALRAYRQIQALDQLAFYDRLSSLPNRNSFISRIDECAAVDKPDDYVIAIVDIDDFSEINDTLGHQRGDRLLQVIAERLTRTFGEDVHVARIGGDTFGVLVHETRLDLPRLLSLFREPFEVLGDAMLVTATIGLRDVRGTELSGTSLLNDANIALKHAKKIRRSQYAYFTDEMGAEMRERIRLLQGLRGAVDSDRLFLAFQPQVQLATGKVVGMEALLRWRNTDGRLVPPDRFIPLAECSGLIISIGDWVLRMSCHALRQLNRQGLRDVRMSVNVSHNQFRNPAFPDTLAAALKDTGVDPSCIELEITESVAMEEPEFVSTLLSRLKKTGVSISIDDFGTGYSSLSQLRVLPVDRLKIDRAFVTGLNETEQSSLIARMVVDLGRSLGLEVIAEGIEFEAEAQALRSLGCMLGQGYLYARPMEMTDLQKWLAHRIPEFTAREDSTDESTAT